MRTTAVFFPFGLFGSPGAAAGAELLADACREMVADNRRERMATRAQAYHEHLRLRELKFETIEEVKDWRKRGQVAARQALKNGDFLLWVTGNHLGVLPVLEELAADGGRTVVVQFDAHLDIYNLSDCTAELSHGNFLLHADGALPAMINVGHRELLLRPEYIRQHYRATFPAAAVAADATGALKELRKLLKGAARIFFDIDCDVLDPGFFPAAPHPLPFGLSPATLLQVLEGLWDERVIGVSLAEFDPGRDRRDQSLATLVWLIEYLLLKRHEAANV